MGCSIFGASLRASKCLSTLQCLEDLTFLWVLSQVGKQGHPLLRHQRSTSHCPCSSKKNTRTGGTGQEPALGRTTLQMNPAPNQPRNTVQKFWERKGIERAGNFHAIFQLSPFNSPSSLNQVLQFSSSTPSPVFASHPWSLRFGSSYLHPLVSASWSWRFCVKNMGLWKFPNQMLSQVRLSQNTRQCSQLHRTLSCNPLNKLSENK